MPYDGDFDEDFEFQEKFLPQQQELARQALRVDVAPVEEDMRRNTDLILESEPLKRGPIRVSARVRRHQYRSRYSGQITQRLRRPSGAATEIDKVLEGYGDFFVYGFESEPGSDRMDPYVVVNLHLVADYIRYGGWVDQRKNKGPYGSQLAGIHLADLPLGAILVSNGLPDYPTGASRRRLGTANIFNRDRAWHQCRRCFSMHAAAEEKPGTFGDGYWRSCLWCGFRWKSGWVAPMVRESST